jgi:hypothetical protein
MKNVINVLSTVKLEKALNGYGYRVVEVATHGVSDADMSINETDAKFLKNGVRVPRRKTGDIYALEVEAYTKGLIVYMYVDKDVYETETAKFLNRLG